MTVRIFADILYNSPAGAMLSQMVHSLLLLPVAMIQTVLPELLALLAQLDKVCRLLPAVAALEEQELEWPVHGKIGPRFPRVLGTCLDLTYATYETQEINTR